MCLLFFRQQKTIQSKKKRGKTKKEKKIRRGRGYYIVLFVSIEANPVAPQSEPLFWGDGIQTYKRLFS